MADSKTFGLTLRAANGLEQRIVAWFPTQAVRDDFYGKAEKRGITIIEDSKKVK